MLRKRKATLDNLEKVVEGRLRGFYDVKQTMDEAIACVQNLRLKPAEKVFTMLRSAGRTSFYDTREFLEQVADWQKIGARVFKENIWHDRDFEELGKATMFIVSPPEGMDVGICPLAVACGKLVTGFAYVTLDKSFVEVVWRALGSHKIRESTP